MATQTTDGAILISDLSAQHVAAVQQRVKLDVAEPNKFDKYFVKKHWPKGVTSQTFRTLVPQKNVTPTSVGTYELAENVAPDYLKVKYANYMIPFPPDHGTKFIYTRKDLQLGADNIIADASSELTTWGKDMIKIMQGNAIKATKNVVAWSSLPSAKQTIMGLIEYLEFAAKKVRSTSTSFEMLCDVRVAYKLNDEYIAKYGANGGGILPVDKVNGEINGEIARYKRTTLIDPECDDVMVEEISGTTYYWVFFICKNSKGENPLLMWDGIGGEGVEIFHNPLGSSILPAKDGNLTSDDNHQMGSVAMNLYGHRAEVVDPRGVFACKVPASYVGGPTLQTGSNQIYTVEDLIAERQLKTQIEFYGDYDRDGSIDDATTKKTVFSPTSSVSPIVVEDDDDGE